MHNIYKKKESHKSVYNFLNHLRTRSHQIFTDEGIYFIFLPFSLYSLFFQKRFSLVEYAFTNKKEMMVDDRMFAILLYTVERSFYSILKKKYRMVGKKRFVHTKSFFFRVKMKIHFFSDKNK